MQPESWGNHVTSREQLDGQVLSGDATALLLERAGIPTARSTFAAGVDDVAGAFAALSASTAVLKVSGLLHKTESGGVVLGLQSAEAATEAAETLYAAGGSGRSAVSCSKSRRAGWRCWWACTGTPS